MSPYAKSDQDGISCDGGDITYIGERPFAGFVRGDGVCGRWSGGRWCHCPGVEGRFKKVDEKFAGA